MAPSASAADADRLLKVRFDSPRDCDAGRSDAPFWPWLADADSVLQGRRGEVVLIRAQGLACFEVWPRGASVHCHPYPRAEPSAVRHFLLNQILPRLISVRESLVLHASAVVTERGAFALVGPAGCGKSTLSVSFVASGQGSLISDDGILVRVGWPSPILVGAYARSRLRPDSYAALGFDESDFAADEPVRGKYVLALPSAHPASGVEHPIRALFLLSQPDCGQGDVAITALSGYSAVMGLIENSFLLESDAPAQLRNQFAGAADLVRSGCRCYALTYPRRFSELARVRCRILAVLGE